VYSANPPKERECPKCKSQNYRLASCRAYEYPALLFFLAPYRCNKCQQRFWSFRARQAKKLGMYILVFGGTIGVIWGFLMLFGRSGSH
jgi:hypothetical protein